MMILADIRKVDEEIWRTECSGYCRETGHGSASPKSSLLVLSNKHLVGFQTDVWPWDEPEKES